MEVVAAKQLFPIIYPSWDPISPSCSNSSSSAEHAAIERKGLFLHSSAKKMKKKNALDELPPVLVLCTDRA
jgi:hypothetical protein